MASDLKKLVESTNNINVLNEEVITEKVNSFVGFIQELNECFNEDLITESEYYENLETVLREWNPFSPKQTADTGAKTGFPSTYDETKSMLMREKDPKRKEALLSHLRSLGSIEQQKGVKTTPTLKAQPKYNPTHDTVTKGPTPGKGGPSFTRPATRGERFTSPA